MTKLKLVMMVNTKKGHRVSTHDEMNKRMAMMVKRGLVLTAVMMAMMRTLLVIYIDSDLDYTLILSKCFEYCVQKKLQNSIQDDCVDRFEI